MEASQAGRENGKKKRRCKPGDLHHFCVWQQKPCVLSLITPSTSADHQALGGRLMRPKGMEDLATFNAREVKRAAAEERERDEYFSAERQWK